MKLNVLVVDDSAAIRKILLRVLSQTDLPIEKVHEASDGVEALKIMNSDGVNLVLSDARQCAVEIGSRSNDHNRGKPGEGSRSCATGRERLCSQAIYR